LKAALGVSEFVDADVIARGISGFDPERAAFAAGRVMLARIRALAEQRVSFGFETTLASRSFAPWIARLKRRATRFIASFWPSQPRTSLCAVWLSECAWVGTASRK
jgi:predicted ABC-type ATPase